MTMTNAFEDLMVGVCLDVDLLEAVQADPKEALREAGVPDWVESFVARRRGSWISSALTLTRPLPTAEEIVAYVDARVPEDPAFADRILHEARPTLERVYQVRFPSATVFDAVEVDGLVRLTVTDLPTEPIGLRAGPSIELTATEPGGDNDVDIDVDVDVDIDVDIDVDVDFIVVVDVDIDVDVDVDTDVVIQTSHPNQTNSTTGAWARYWDDRRDLWKSRDDRLVRSN